MNRRAIFGRGGRFAFVFSLVLAIECLSLTRGFCAEGEAADNFPSTPKDYADFEARVVRAVKDFNYADEVAQDFVKMVRLWRCDEIYQKLSQAVQDVKAQKSSWSQYAQVEEEEAKRLAETMKKEISAVNTSIKANTKYFDLAIIVTARKTQCLMAIADINKAIELKPDSANSYNKRGVAYGQSGQTDKALLDFNKAIELDPAFAGAFSNRGKIYSQAGKHAEALSDFGKAIELKPEFAEAYNFRGVGKARSGKFVEAIADFDKALDLNPEYCEAYSNRGCALNDSGRPEKALSDFNKALEFNPNYAEAYNNRGRAYGKMHQLPEAIADFSKAIELNSQYPNPYMGRAFAYALLGKKEEAAKDLREVMRLDPKAKRTARDMADRFKLEL